MLSYRTAICFSGQIRTGVETAPALRKFIGDMWNSCDFFVHTWSTNTRSKHAANTDTQSHIVSPQIIDSIKTIYSPVSMVVDDIDAVQADVYIQTGITPSGQLPMFRSIYEANLLKSKYEIACNSKYLAVIRLRFDQVFDNSATLLQELQYFANSDRDAYLNTCDFSNKLPNAVEDVAWLGTSATIDIASNFLQVRERHNTGVDYMDWQSHFKLYLEENSIKPHHWKNNNLYIYRDHHATANISPFATELLV